VRLLLREAVVVVAVVEDCPQLSYHLQCCQIRCFYKLGQVALEELLELRVLPV
jgi:hypothetical protein